MMADQELSSVEDIIATLKDDTNTVKNKSLYEACTKAHDILNYLPEPNGKFHQPFQFREACFLPLQMALESCCNKMVDLAISGFQTILTDERFHSDEDSFENVELQLPTQFLEAISTVSLQSEDVQTEIMKLLQNVLKRYGSKIHGVHLIKVVEVCIETFVNSNIPTTKSASQITLKKLVTPVCNGFKDITQNQDTLHMGTDASKLLRQDIVILLKHFSTKLHSQNGESVQQQSESQITLCLENVYLILSAITICMQQEKEFVTLVWKTLCPALIELLGSSLVDTKARTIRNNYEISGEGRGSIGSQQIAKVIYSIAGELVRLIGNLKLLRPTLETLFRQILLCSQTQNQLEALKVLKELLGSPQRIFDLAGPTIKEHEASGTTESSIDQRKSDLELFLLIMEGVQKSSQQTDISISSASVSCVVTFLATLEDLSNARGLCDEHIELLKNVIDENDGKYDDDDDKATTLLSLKCSNLDSDNDNEDKPSKPRHIRWLMDYEDNKIDPEEEVMSKSVSWAEHHEERIIDYREQFSDPKQKLYSCIKSRTDSGLNFQKFNRDKATSSTSLVRSQSALNLHSHTTDSKTSGTDVFPLRRVSSTSKLEVIEKFAEPIKVSVASLKKYHKTNGRKQIPVIKRSSKSTTRHLPGLNEEAKSPKPILRKQQVHHTDENIITAKEIKQEDATKPFHMEKMKKEKHRPQVENHSPSKETTINGIPLSKLPRKKQRNSKTSSDRVVKHKIKNKSPSNINQSEPPKKTPKPPQPDSPPKTIEELEREGARNFARCLLGILPSALAATEPSVADNLLQQFSSDVCEAVTCLTLKRKPVPHFGTVRSFEEKTDGLEKTEPSNDPILNADGVYKAVYETLKLNYQLNNAGYYKKSEGVPHISQDTFIDAITRFKFPVRLSRVWLEEVYRLVTTYDILYKAGYKSESSETNRALIGMLSEQLYTQRLNRINGMEFDTQVAMTTCRKSGMGFAKRLLTATWEQVLNTLVIPLDPATGNFTIWKTELIDSKEFANTASRLSLDRDLVCLTLDGLRRTARLCCDLDIQSGCDVILARLSQASCSFLNDEVKHQSRNGMMLSVKLHAAHVLSMDALLAVGLELGSHAPKAWSHVFLGCKNISTLEQASFADIDSGSTPCPSTLPLPLKSDIIGSDFYASSITSNESFSPDSTNSFSPVIEKRENASFTSSGFLPPEDACRAVYALSNAVDNLFDMAATALPLKTLKEFLVSLVESSCEQLFKKKTKIDPGKKYSIAFAQEQLLSMDTLHLYHICEVMLRCARNNTRPLLHVMEAWSVISAHLIEAALSKDNRISKVALTSLHDIISELLKRRNELPHFWFYNVMFKPFELLMGIHATDEDIQDQILFTLYELVENYAPSIKSGWRTIFASLSQAHIYTQSASMMFSSEVEERRKVVLSIVEHFVQLKTTNMFAAGAISSVLCLLKFIRYSPRDMNSSDDSYEIRADESVEDIASETNSSDDYKADQVDDNDDLCQPSLEMLSKISKRLSTIYIQPSSTIFFGSYDIVLANMSESQDKIWDDTWSCSSNNTSNGAECEMKTSSTATSIIAIDETGILRIWFLILEGLTSTVTKCPKSYRPMVIELLFEIMNSITTVPGPHFSMFVISNLLLPLLKSWLNQGCQRKSYWDLNFHDFKHACGLATQLIVEEMENFLKVEGAEDCVPIMLEQLLDLFHDCISQPLEAIARLGCSCLRHLLLSAGPQFTEELWHILCNGIKQIIDSTLSQLRRLLTCFEPGSNSVTGDNGTNVKIVARRNITPSEALRALQLAEQVFLLESQVSEETLRMEEDLDDDDIRSYVFLIISPDGKDVTSPNKIRIPFRSLTVALLANQILLQMLGSILLESADSVNGPIISTITHAGLLKRNNKESSLPGLLNYLSPNNLNILFDCLLDAHNVAHEFNTRPGLRCLTQKLARLDTRANLFRTSITSFAFYLNTLFQISKYDGEHFSISNIKRILTGEKVMLDPVSPESPEKMVKSGKAELLKNSEEIDWVIRHLHEACNQITNMYQKLHQSHTFKEQDSGFVDNMSSSFSSIDGSPQKQQTTELLSEETLKLMKGIHLNQAVSQPKKKYHSPFRSKKNMEDEKTALQNLKKKEDDILHLSAWSQLIISMLDLLLALPVLQFKSVLPAVFPAVTSLITTVQDPKIRQLVCDVVRRSGSIYGII